jgi:hypothetical protein
VARPPGRQEVGAEEGEGGDVPEVGGVELGFGGEVGVGCSGVYGGGEGEEGREGNGGEGGGYALILSV